MLRSRWPVLLGVIVVFFWLGWTFFALSITSFSWVPDFLRLPVEDQATTILARRGQFGDAFGAFNALVSTFALIGLFFTINSQQHQIKEQAKLSAASDLLIRQQQFQEQYYRAIETYSKLLSEISFNAGGPGSESLKGRLAMWEIWRSQVIGSLVTNGDTQFELAVQLQQNAYKHESLGAWNTNEEATSATANLLSTLKDDPACLQAALDAIGVAWTAMYAMNRFQLDALFRAWYTVFRVLGTAERYEIDAEIRRLYSATFRAQLSWIEMAFLLANQSHLPGTSAYPRACYYSNQHTCFDNLDVAHDAIIAVLYTKALVNVESINPESVLLCRKAFEPLRHNA